MMYVNHLNNPLPYLMLKVCCDDVCVHARYDEKPKSIRRGTTPIPNGLGSQVKTASTGVSRLLRAATAIVSDIKKYLIGQLSRLIFYLT